MPNETKDLKKRILLTRPLGLSAQAKRALHERFEVNVSPSPAENDLATHVTNVHCIIAHGSAITKRVIQSAPSLQLISTPQVGFDKIDVGAATRAGVGVIANTGLSPNTVAEFTLGLMIALARRIVSSDHDLRQKRDWAAREAYVNPDLEMGFDLHGATVGLVGFGSIGSAVARLCKNAFSAQLLAYDPFVSRERMAAQGAEKCENLIELAEKSDFISLHMALTVETKHMIDGTILHAMKPGAYLVSCARGAVVDEKALIMALRNGWIAGAATDVFEEEPINSSNPLLDMRNVIVTPHIAGITRQSSIQRGEELVKRILDFFSGNKPEGLVNPEIWRAYRRSFDL